MIRSLYSGVSGMKSHQVRMDVVGNNIANVNTTGYKAGRANFQDTLYQTINAAGEKTNPAQAGLGISLASITSDMTSGGLKSTGRTLDLAISGSGFFKVTDGVNDYYTRDGIFNLTQNGNLVNSNGYQVIGESWDKAQITGTQASPTIPAAGGILELQGTLADGSAGAATSITFTGGLNLDEIISHINQYKDTTGVIAAKDSSNQLTLSTVYDGYTSNNTLTIDPTPSSTPAILTELGLTSGATDSPSGYTSNADIVIDNIPVATLNILDEGLITGTDTGGNALTFGGQDVARISLNVFKNQDGLERAGKNLFQRTASSGDASSGAPATPGFGTIQSGYIEMSNVDLTDQFTDMITTQRGYQAGARIITVSDTMLEELINLKR